MALQGSSDGVESCSDHYPQAPGGTEQPSGSGSGRGAGHAAVLGGGSAAHARFPESSLDGGLGVMAGGSGCLAQQAPEPLPADEGQPQHHPLQVLTREAARDQRGGLLLVRPIHVYDGMAMGDEVAGFRAGTPGHEAK